jgi:hypothetical protein
MKKIISLFSLILVMVSCSKSDNIVDTVLDTYTNGAVLRGWNPAGGYNFFAPSTSIFSVSVEAHDRQDGGLMQQVEVFVDLNGNFKTLHKTLLPADFATGPTGLPRYDLAVSLGDALATMNKTSADYTGGDFININLKLTLTDGRTFEAKDAASSLTGSYFKSPYIYPLQIKCIPPGAVPGVYTVNMRDSYGDGWNGGYVKVTVDGVVTTIGMPDAYGDYPVIDAGHLDAIGNDSAAYTDFTIAAGAVDMSWEWVGGAYVDEVSFDITVDVGDGVIQSAFGPASNPDDGVKVLSVCPPTS